MKFFILLLTLFLVGCGCDKYASDYSCSYVIDEINNSAPVKSIEDKKDDKK